MGQAILALMSILERIAKRIRSTNSTLDPNSRNTVHAALEAGRQHKRAERYEEALIALDEAANHLRTTSQKNGSSLALVVDLHRADILLHLGQWDAMQALLNRLQAEARERQQYAPLAYIYGSMGTLAQAQGDWDSARRHYEAALDMARKGHSAGAEGRAQGHLADIYLREGNASYAIYLLREALPKLEISGDLELTSYFTGKLGESLIAAGQEVEGQRLLGRALRLAEEMEHRRYEIQWRQALTAEAMKNALYDESRRHLLQVLAHMDGTPSLSLVQTLCRAAKASLRLGDSRSSLDYANQAVELTNSLPADRRAYALAHGALGIAQRATHQPQAAVESLESVLDDYVSLMLTEADYTYIELLRNLAAAQTENKHFEDARQTYERALNHAEGSDSQAHVAGTHRDIGIMYLHQNHLQEAIRSWLTALEIYEAQSDHTRAARLLCDIAGVRKQLGQGQRAMKNYEQALMHLSSIEDQETRGIILSNAATAYADQGDIETAESFFVDSIKLAQQTQDRVAEATRRGNYGWFLLSTGRAQRALDVLAYAIRQSQNLGLTLQTAVQTDNTGLAHDELGNLSDAERFHRQALDLLDDNMPGVWRATFQANLAHTLVNLGHLDEAASLFHDALVAGESSDNVELTVKALNGQAKIALNRHQLQIAGENVQRAIELAGDATQRRLLADALVIRSQWHILNVRPEQAEADWHSAEKHYLALRLAAGRRPPAWYHTTSD